MLWASPHIVSGLYCAFVWGPHVAMLRADSWLCAPGWTTPGRAWGALVIAEDPTELLGARQECAISVARFSKLS